MRYKAITGDRKTFRHFKTKKSIEEWIQSQIRIRGLKWRKGYLIRFGDGLKLDIVKRNGNRIK